MSIENNFNEASLISSRVHHKKNIFYRMIFFYNTSSARMFQAKRSNANDEFAITLNRIFNDLNFGIAVSPIQNKSINWYTIWLYTFIVFLMLQYLWSHDVTRMYLHSQATEDEIPCRFCSCSVIGRISEAELQLQSFHAIYIYIYISRQLQFRWNRILSSVDSCTTEQIH